MNAAYRHDAEPLRDLAARAIDDGKAFVRAEITFAKAVAASKTRQIVPAVVFFIVASLILQAALTVLVLSLGHVLAWWIGMAGGLAVAGTFALLLAGLAAYLGIRKVKGLAS